MAENTAELCISVSIDDACLALMEISDLCLRAKTLTPYEARRRLHVIGAMADKVLEHIRAGDFDA